MIATKAFNDIALRPKDRLRNNLTKATDYFDTSWLDGTSTSVDFGSAEGYFETTWPGLYANRPWRIRGGTPEMTMDLERQLAVIEASPTPSGDILRMFRQKGKTIDFILAAKTAPRCPPGTTDIYLNSKTNGTYLSPSQYKAATSLHGRFQMPAGLAPQHMGTIIVAHEIGHLVGIKDPLNLSVENKFRKWFARQIGVRALSDEVRVDHKGRPYAGCSATDRAAVTRYLKTLSDDYRD